MQTFITYILFSQSLETYYIGYTGDDMLSRLVKHLGKHKGYTSKAKDWIIVYTEQFSTKKEALKREKQLKAWKSPLRLKQLIDRSSTE